MHDDGRGRSASSTLTSSRLAASATFVPKLSGTVTILDSVYPWKSLNARLNHEFTEANLAGRICMLHP